MGNHDYHLVAIKRNWVPGWFWWIVAKTGIVVWLWPLREMMTKAVEEGKK